MVPISSILIAAVALLVVHLATQFVPVPIAPVRMWAVLLTAAFCSLPVAIALAVLVGVISAVAEYWVLARFGVPALRERWSSHPWITALLDRIGRFPFWVVVALNGIGVPDFWIGVYASVEKYPLRRFVMATAIGRVVHFWPLLLGGYAAHQIWGWILDRPEFRDSLLVHLGNLLIFLPCLALVLLVRRFRSNCAPFPDAP